MNQILTKKWVAERLPKRPKDANKGTFGKVLVVAGSENYPGAAYLSTAACYRVGAGLVTLATTPSVKIIVSRKLPEVTFLSRNEVLGKIDEYDVLLIGPGLGQSDQAVELITEVVNEVTNLFIERLCSYIAENRIKTIIDGDGLNILSKMEKWWEKIKGEVILTPHSGEMARLTGLDISKIQSDRSNVAQYYAKTWGTVVALKGANTVVVSPTEEVLFSPFANPSLATAGTGDVLAGVIAGLLAQGLKSFDAVGVGVYIHGLAGEKLREKTGDAGALASELLPLLPRVIQDLVDKPEHRVS